MLKTKTKKFNTKIICAALLIMLAIFNSCIIPQAYAADAPKPPADTTCTDKGWTELDKDSYKCQKKGDENAKCSDLGTNYYIVNSETITKEEADAANPIQITCAKVTKGVADTSNLLKQIEVLSQITSFLNRLLWPVLVLIGGLMENDLLFGSGMEERLRDIWIPIRNLVNILFVIVLVGIALYNVLGLGEEGGHYSIKAVLPQLIVGIIAVNFSFIGIKIVLDAINVMTTSVFALPNQINEGLAEIIGDNPDKESVKRLCANWDGVPIAEFDQQTDQIVKQQQESAIYQKVSNQKPSLGGDKTYAIVAGIGTGDSVQQIKDKIHAQGQATEDNFNKDIQASSVSKLCTGKGLTDQGKLFLKRYNSRNAAFALALNMGKIVFYQDIKFDVKNAEKLFVNTVFSLLLYLVYVASFLALFIVLLGRLVVMWLSIAISPVLLLMIATPTLKEKIGGFSKLSEQFVKNALAPLLISLAMTIGWIMLKAIQGLNLTASKNTFGANSALVMDPVAGIPVVGLNTLQDFVVALGVIAVVWLGVFSAAEGTIAQFATDWLKQHLQMAAKWVGSIPLRHLPIVPISLPGHEHEKYTIAQTIRGFSEILHGESDDKLAQLIRGKPSATPDNLKNIRDTASIYDYLRRADDLASAKQRTAIGNWLKDSANKKAVDEMEKTNPDLLKDMRALAKADDKEAKPIADRIKANEKVRSSADVSATPPSLTKKKGKTPEPATISPATSIGGTTVGKALGDGTKEKTTVDTALKTTTTQKTELETEIKKDTPDKDTVKTKIEALRKTFADQGHNLTEGEFKDLMGEEQYQKTVKAVGGPEEFGKIFKPAASPAAAPGTGTPAGTPPPPPASP